MGRLTLLDIPIDPLTEAEAVEWVARAIQQPRARQIVSINPERLMQARSDRSFAELLKKADLSLADGVGVMWAARRVGHPLPERVTGVDFVRALASRGAKERWRFFFLGAAPGVAEEAAGVLAAQYPGLQVAGTFAGSPRVEEEAEICKRIRSARADLLVVAYGAGAEEGWIARNLEKTGVKVAMGVGGALDFISGRTRRAPKWMRERGVEWLYRLVRQPWRWRRQLALPRFALVVLLSRRNSRNPAL
jgi:N-acetylglucosaminyldiphosphoundecaprenol N-acetyl-beta-D-mannosaminyltransferase